MGLSAERLEKSLLLLSGHYARMGSLRWLWRLLL
jgi:hypothetical protein